MRWSFQRRSSLRHPRAVVRYIKKSEKEVVIRTERPGEEPVETVAEVFPSDARAADHLEPLKGSS